MNIPIYRLFKELEKMQADRQTTLFYFKQVTYNGFKESRMFSQHLNVLFKNFKYAIHNLPQTIPEKDNRKTFLSNLYHDLLIIQKDQENFYIQKILPYFVICHDIHQMFQVQQNMTVKAMKVLAVFARHDGYNLGCIYDENGLEQPPCFDNSTSIRWTGKNKTEFIQLIYALHHARLINHGNGEITKIVEKIAGILNIELNKQWQSVHSKSIHARNNDYEVVIFQKLENAYVAFREERIERAKTI